MMLINTSFQIFCKKKQFSKYHVWKIVKKTKRSIVNKKQSFHFFALNFSFSFEARWRETQETLFMTVTLAERRQNKKV